MGSAPRPVLHDLAYTLRVVLLGGPGGRPWTNLLMAFIPLAAAADAWGWPSSATFLLALLSMLPLAERLGFCTEALSEHCNDTAAGLINASMGNAPELIIALFALNSGKLDVVKESLIGSVLSNLLLVMGTALVLGGARVRLQSFNSVLSPQNASLLLVCCLAVFMPTCMVAAGLEVRPGAALLVSRLSSAVLLLLYGAYLVFQLKTHAELFDDGGEGGAGGGSGASEEREEGEGEESRPLTASGGALPLRLGSGGAAALEAPGAAGGGDAQAAAAAAGSAALDDCAAEAEDGERLSLLGATFGLAVMAALVAYVSDILVDTIEGAGAAWGVPPAFIAAMLVPIAGNAAEHTSALIFAYKDRLDLALGICVGSAVQIFCFVLPLVVVAGWGAGQPLSLDFRPFELGLLLFSVLIASFTLLPGKSHYLAGAVHVAAYLLMGAGYLMYSGACPAGSVESQSTSGSALCRAGNGTSL